MKYKLLKELTGEAIVETACGNKFNLFVRKYGYTEIVDWNEENENFIINQNEWIKYLLDNKYIEENKQKIVFDETKIYIFDETKIYIVIVNGIQFFKLSQIMSNFAFIDLNQTIKCTLSGTRDTAQKIIDYTIERNYIIDVFDNIFDAIKYYQYYK